MILDTSPPQNPKVGFGEPSVLVETIRVELAEIKEKINLTGEFGQMTQYFTSRGSWKDNQYVFMTGSSSQGKLD